MKNGFTANYAKIAVIAISLAIAVSCTVAGTLAAFSATYTWSGSATAGDINFSDTSFTLDIFDDGYVFPGEYGSSELGGVDFGANPVAWSFSSSNSSVMPVVFYTLSESGSPEEGSFYSEYGFAEMAEYYVKCPDGTAVALGSVSDDVTAVASHLAIGGTLCWAWFDEFYTDADCMTPAEGEAVDGYRDYCLSICSAAYGFSASISTSAGDGVVHAFVTGQTGQTLSVHSFSLQESYIGIRDGLPFICDVPVSVETGGVFGTPASSAGLTADSAMWLLVPEGRVIAFESMLDSADVRYTAEGKYSMTASADSADTAVPDEENGTRILYKVYPSSVGEKAQISVTVTATVTF